MYVKDLQKYLKTLAAYLRIPSEFVKIEQRPCWFPPRSKWKKRDRRKSSQIPMLLSKNIGFPGCYASEGKQHILKSLKAVDQFRSLKGWFYKKALVRFPTLVTNNVLIVPSDKIGELGEIILFCKRKIRILDSNSGEVTCILLDGLPDSYIQDELSIRSVASKSLSIPPILRVGFDVSPKYYVEEFINGHSLRRWEFRKTEFQSKISQLLKQLWLIYKVDNCRQTVPLLKYAENLMTEIRRNTLYEDSPLRDLITTVYSQLCKMHLRGILPPMVSLCQAHGDLSPGNILSRDGKLFLLDWENTRKLSTLHDFINFHVLTSLFLGTPFDISDILRKLIIFDHPNDLAMFSIQALTAHVYLWVIEKALFLNYLGDLYSESRDMTYSRQRRYRDTFIHAISGTNYANKS